MLQGQKIRLRPVVESDMAVFAAWANDQNSISGYNTFGLQRANVQQKGFTEDGLLSAERGVLFVVTEDGAIAGSISYNRTAYGPSDSNRAYNIGINLIADERGKGYGTEAQKLLAAYLFATYPIERVEAQTDIANIPEQRALEKAGFSREGVLRRAQWRNGQWHDLVVYSKLRDE